MLRRVQHGVVVFVELGVRQGQALCQRREADDGGETVVEIVGDAAGQPPDRLDLLALLQLDFELA